MGKAKDTLLKEIARQLLGTTSREDIDNIRALKAKSETIACEVGLIMTAIHIQEIYKLKVEDSDPFSNIFCKYINKAQEGLSKAGANRALIMTGDSRVESLFNFLTKLNPRNWLEFRCLWIELLAENQGEFEQEMRGSFPHITGSLTQSVQDAREVLYNLFLKEIEKKNKDFWEDKIKERAANQALRKRFAAMEYWLDWSKEKFFDKYKVCEENNMWARLINVQSANPAVIALNDDQESVDDEEVDEEN